MESQYNRYREMDNGVTSESLDWTLGATPYTQDYSFMNDCKGMKDVVLARFGDRIKNRELLPINPMMYTTYKVFDGGNHAFASSQDGNPHQGGTFNWIIQEAPPPGYVTHNPSGFDAWGPNMNSSDFSGPSDDALVTAAVANGKAPVWDTLTFMAEAGKTLDMFVNNIDRVAKGIEYIHHKAERKAGKRSRRNGGSGSRKARAKRYSSALADLWLEARYGWRPLLADINDAMEAFDKMSEDFKISRGYAKSTTLLTETETGLSIPKSAWTVTPEWSRETELTVRAGSIYEIFWQNLMGSSAIRTGWETIPFSFVLDWFLNVGDYLESMVPTPGLSLRSTWISKRWNWRSTGTVKFSDLASGIVIETPYQGWMTVSGTTYSRYPTSVPITPSVYLNLDLWKLVDSIALIRHVRKKVLGGRSGLRI